MSRRNSRGGDVISSIFLWTIASLLIIGTAVGLKYVINTDFGTSSEDINTSQIIPVTSEDEPSSEVQPSSEEEPPIETRQNLVTFDFTTTVTNRALDSNTVITFFNKSVSPGVIKSVIDINKVDTLGYVSSGYAGIDIDSNPLAQMFNAIYEDNYLKFGSSSKSGFLALDFNNNFTFTNIKVVGANFGSYNATTGVWSSDSSAIVINDQAQAEFSTNAADTTKAPAFETREVSFEDPQEILILSTLGKRLYIKTIEMWTV